MAEMTPALLSYAHDLKTKGYSPETVRQKLSTAGASKKQIQDIIEQLGGTCWDWEWIIVGGEREVLEGTTQFNKAFAGYIKGTEITEPGRRYEKWKT